MELDLTVECVCEIKFWKTEKRDKPDIISNLSSVYTTLSALGLEFGTIRCSILCSSQLN